MQVVASPVRPALTDTYEVAGRLLLVNTSSSTISRATNRVLSQLRVLRVSADAKVSPAAVLKLSSAKFAVPKGVASCAITEEAHYYNNQNSYLVQLGDSVISADASPVVNASLAEDMDYQSILFGRVLAHGLSTALRRAGAFELHSAAVIEPETKVGALIVGSSGSGKSTLTLHLAARGWNFATDDVVLLTAGTESIEAHGLREFFAITGETILHSGLSQLDPWMEDYTNNTAAKIRLPPEIFPSQLVDKCVPGFLIFPRKTGESRSRVQQLPQSDVMKRLLSMCPWAAMDRPVAADFLGVLGLLTRQCKAFDLFAGTDLLDDPEYTSTFLTSIIREQAA